MFPRTKHFRTCSYSRDKFLCLNDVNNDTRVHFIATFGLSLKPWGIALKFLFLHHENILFPND